MTNGLVIRGADETRWDLVALGEVMLRLDPGAERIHTTRSFRVWEGGAEYNVARGLRRCFGLRTTIVTALADNPIGRLIEDLMLQGGVDLSHLRWIPYDGVGRTVRNGLNFTERGFGVRAPLGCSDRGHTAASQLQPGDLDWEAIFEHEGARVFHSGGVFAALSATTPLVVEEAMTAARRRGILVSYDLNYRPSLWEAAGGPDGARAVNRRLVRLADVVVGNEEDFTEALGFDVRGLDPERLVLEPASFAEMLSRVCETFPNVRLAAVTLRRARSATRNDWSAVAVAGGRTIVANRHEDLEIYDRVGGGDAFVAGLLYGLLAGLPAERALAYGVAHGALAMTTPGDNSMVRLEEVERLVRGAGARILR